MYALRGVPLWAIQYLGRWGGGSVRLYTAEASRTRGPSLDGKPIATDESGLRVGALIGRAHASQGARGADARVGGSATISD